MTNKMTRNNLNKYTKLVNTGNSGLGNLLNAVSEDGYNSGLYGWNWTVYNVNGVGVINAYRNVPKYAIIPDRCLMNKYNAMGYGKSLEEKIELLNEFIKDVVNNENN